MLLQTSQLLLQLRRTAQGSVGDLSALLGLAPLPLELLNLRLLVHRHLERQLSVGAERAQRQLPSGDVLNQPVRAPRLVHHPGGVLRAPAAAAPPVEAGQAWPKTTR